MRQLKNCVTTSVAILWLTTCAQAQQNDPPVVVTKVIEKTLSPQRLFVGTVFPLRSAVVGSAVDGRVEKFLVNEGDGIKEGADIAVLRPAIIKAELSEAKAALRTRHAEYEELKNSLPEEIEQATAKLQAADALRGFYKTVLERIRTAGIGVSAKERDEAVSNSVQSEATYRQAKAALKLTKFAGPEKLAQAKARVETQIAVVERLQTQLERHTIRAPFDGFVVAEHTEKGNWLKKGDTVVEIVQLDTVDIEVQVLEDYIGYVNVGDAVVVKVGAFPKETFQGKIALVVPRANLRSRTFPVKIRVTNRTVQKTRMMLKAGMFARVMLPVGTKEKALLVPRDALKIGGAKRVVYVVDKGNIAREVPVTLGFAHDDFVQITGNLKKGDLVVVQGNVRLRSGQKVKIVQK